VVLGLLLDLVLSFAVGIVLWNLSETNGRLEDQNLQVQQAVAREAATRQEVLCPLYGVIVGSFNPDSRPPGPQRDEYLRNFEVINGSYPKLNCANPVVPGSTAGTPR
jgi:hypothetical protein